MFLLFWLIKKNIWEYFLDFQADYCIFSLLFVILCIISWGVYHDMYCIMMRDSLYDKYCDISQDYINSADFPLIESHFPVQPCC